MSTVNLDQKITTAQGEAQKEINITSIERASLRIKAGTKPFYIRESDTGRLFYWNGLVFKDLTDDPGVFAINSLRVASNIADAETVEIGSRVYEFDRAANGVVAGNIAVTGHADDTPTNALTALAVIINADNLSEVNAFKISANELLVVSKLPGAITTALSETLAGANNAWASANLFGGREAGSETVSIIRRAPNAQEVALGVMHFCFDFAPILKDIRAVVTATPGVAVDWDGAVTISGNRLTIDNTGSTDWATTSTIILTVAK